MTTLRQQFGFNTNVGGMTLWTPTTDGNVTVANVAENYYQIVDGVVTLDLCVMIVVGVTVNISNLTDLPVTPAGGEIVSNAVTVYRIEDRATLPATADLNETIDSNLVEIDLDSDDFIQGGFYIIGGTLDYNALVI